MKTILPEFNLMALFEVQPGMSFHSVQEVFCDRPRSTIRGWYHAKESTLQIENATLQRLKSIDKGGDTEGGFEPLVTSDNLNPESNGECESEDENIVCARMTGPFLASILMMHTSLMNQWMR